MQRSWKQTLFETCPKSGRIVGVRQPQGASGLLFVLTGAAALVWFLVRVVPKPSRASYPCQRVALPLAGGFLAWLVGLGGTWLALHGIRGRLRDARYSAAALALVLLVAGLAWSVTAQPSTPALAAYTAHPTNSPLGQAKGLAPGRVVWVHDPDVTDWGGPGSGQRWYNRVSQSVANQMVSDALQEYTDTTSDAAAWEALFDHHTGGDTYRAGQKFFIKTNMTTSYAGGGTANIDANYNWNPQAPLNFDSIGNSPQLMLALIDQLVNTVGVEQEDIAIGDTTGLWINELYNPLHSAFPDVVYMDSYGQQGRTRAEFSTEELHWSTTEASGKTQDYLPESFADATYVINLAILKSHDRNGITLTAKNHFGSMIRTPTGSLRGVNGNWLELHHFLPMSPGGGGSLPNMGYYRPLVDLNGHEGVGGKTILHMVDGIFGGKNWDAAPSRWAMTPFNNDWPSSLFVSMDQVAIDSVGHDFLAQKWPEHVLTVEGVQDYLHEMALADDPPSGAYYDPEDDGSYLGSLGVHEHWNNATDKEYTRNLGSGNGIELVYVGDAAGPTPTPTFTPTPDDVVYVSSNTGGTVGGISFQDEDILSYSEGTGTWAMVFDASDVGVTADLNAFSILSGGDLLLSFDAAVGISGLGTVDDSDIVRFTPSSLGPTTSGTFAWYFDGSDVGLTTAEEDIDAIGFSADGDLVISTTGSFSVSGVSGADEDMIEFADIQLGATTSGTWSWHFDGSDVALTQSSEDVIAVWRDPASGHLYLSTLGAFSVSGASGTGSDVFVCAPSSLGSNTVCTFGPGLYWDGSAFGFGSEVLDALEIDL